MLQGILKKRRKYGKRHLKTHKRVVEWQAYTHQCCCDVGGRGKRMPRLVHATSREGKKRKAGTRATRTIHMKDEVSDEINMAAHWKSYELCNNNN